MPAGNLSRVKPDRSTLPAWPEPVEFFRDSYSVELHTMWLDASPRVLVGLFGVEYVLALQFSELYKPMWWLDEIRALHSEASPVLAVPRGPGQELPAGAGAPGDGQRAPVVAWREGPLEGDGRHHDYVPRVAESTRQLSPFDSVGNWRAQ